MGLMTSILTPNEENHLLELIESSGKWFYYASFYFLFQRIEFRCIEKLSQSNSKAIANHFDGQQLGILAFSIKDILNTGRRQYLNYGIRQYYVGAYGSFDRMAASALKTVKKRYRDISLYLLLPYHPAERPLETPEGFDGTFLSAAGKSFWLVCRSVWNGTLFYIGFEDKCPCIDGKIIGSIYTIGVLSANVGLF